MLSNFFKLNTPFSTMTLETELLDHFSKADHIKDVLYAPDTFSPKRPKNRLKGKHFQNVSFSKTQLLGLEFRSCTFTDCLFIGTIFEDCEFHRCSFVGCNFHKSVFRKTYIDPAIFSKIFDPKKHANIGVHLFQQLFSNAAESHQREFATSAEYYFKKWKRYELDWERSQGEIGWFEYWRTWVPDFAYWLVAGYGLRSRFFAFWSFVLIASVLAVNHFLWDALGILNNGSVISPNSITDTIYFSLVTVSTVGYGDFVPSTSAGRLIVSVEALVGIIWLSLFASTVIKRVAR